MASLIFIAVVAAVLAAKKGHAVPVDTSISQRAQGTCQQINIPVTASAPARVYDFIRITNDIEAREFAINTETWTTPLGTNKVLQNITVSSTYNIHAQLCVPSNAQSSKIQILTHGLFYDGRYWDPSLYDYQNSYVNAALAEGYATLAYDRLGAGQSDKPDAYSGVQAPIELEILHELTLMARNGSLYKLASVASSSPAPTELVHVGHSYGSFLTERYLGTYPNDTSGAIITGWITNKETGLKGATSADLAYAAGQQGYSDRPEGYCAMGPSGVQNVFFGGRYNKTDQAASSFTDEFFNYGVATSQPIPAGEWISQGSNGVHLSASSVDLTAPVQYFVSEFDFLACAGNCVGSFNETTVHAAFPNAKDFQIYIQPNTGHGQPFHNNATAGYRIQLDFLKRNGL